MGEHTSDLTISPLVYLEKEEKREESTFHNVLGGREMFSCKYGSEVPIHLISSFENTDVGDFANASL